LTAKIIDDGREEIIIKYNIGLSIIYIIKIENTKTRWLVVTRGTLTVKEPGKEMQKKVQTTKGVKNQITTQTNKSNLLIIKACVNHA